MLMRSLYSLRYVATCLLLLVPAACVQLTARSSGHGKWLQIEAVKRGILDYLGLEQPPAIGRSVSREEEERMYQLFLVNVSSGSSSGRAGIPATAVTTLHVIPVLVGGAGHGGAATSKNFDQRLTFCFFNSSDIYPGLRIVRAELKLFQHFLANQSLQKSSPVSGRRASVYEILEATSPGGEPSYRLLDTKSLDSGPVAGVSFDVRPLVERWMGSGLQQVQVQLQFHPPHPDRPLVQQGDGAQLEIETRVQRRRGRRAASSGEDCRRRQRSCCRKSLRVSFKEIGWNDWIRAPESYNMYNCGGACPANYRPANMHAMIKSAMHQLSGGTSPALCCIPAAFEPMTLLHYSSEGTLTLTAFEGMIVTNCHCS
ncbi:growth/differentiation factor 15-like [Leucoraja erinacea]|uniref:growth/differentiation factor 15-like n=1 Tax=Leucoraja erinaceus TaxID=7782 RepID=UPI00245857BD|nr:growth/differentiation factor 15-like [Leucoraja erinacea]